MMTALRDIEVLLILLETGSSIGGEKAAGILRDTIKELDRLREPEKEQGHVRAENLKEIADSLNDVIDAATAHLHDLRDENLKEIADSLNDVVDAATAHLHDLRTEIAAMESRSANPAVTISEHAKAILEMATRDDLIRAWGEGMSLCCYLMGKDEANFRRSTTFLNTLGAIAPPLPDPLVFKVGGVYRTRGGSIAILSKIDAGSNLPLEGTVSGSGKRNWCGNGRWSMTGEDNHLDLVAMLDGELKT